MLDLFLKGGPLMWPLLVLSVISIAIIIEKEVFFLRNRTSSTQIKRIKEAIASGDRTGAIDIVSGSPKLILRFIDKILANADESLDIAEKEISLEGDKLLFFVRRYIHVQELIGSIAPLIGLSGTVLGLVEAFREIDISSASQIDPSLLAGGIWVAMITTVAGLFTAIPSLIFAHINRERVKKFAFSMKVNGEEINSLLHKG